MHTSATRFTSDYKARPGPYTRPPIRARAHTRSDTHTRTRAHPHEHTHTLAHARTRAHTHAHARTRTRAADAVPFHRCRQTTTRSSRCSDQ